MSETADYPYERRAEPQPPTNGNGMERHLQTAIQVFIIALLMWFANKTIDTSDSLIRLEATVAGMAKDITNLTSVVRTDRYTASDATKDKTILTLQLNSLSNKIAEQEAKYAEMSAKFITETDKIHKKMNPMVHQI